MELAGSLCPLSVLIFLYLFNSIKNYQNTIFID